MSDPASTPAAEWRPRANPWLIALAVMLATFMVILDTSIAVVALPYIAGNLGATQDESTWVLTSYLVANAIILPASTWFSGVMVPPSLATHRMDPAFRSLLMNSQ